jgi:peptide/nickel transport system permease protein
MLRFALKKLIQGAAMLIAVSAIAFFLLASAGGDALSGLRENPQISASTIESLERVYGLDRPLPERYALWAASMARGDMGESLLYRISVFSLVGSRFLNTAILGLAALILSAGLAFGLAFSNVRWPSRMLSVVIEVIILLTASTPRIVLSLLALVVVARFAIAPPPAGSIAVPQLILGALALGLPLVSIFLAQLREGYAEAMNQDFVRLARAKGLSETAVIIRHATRAAIGPFLTIFGLSLGGLLGGSVVVEAILGWPGIGALMITAVRGRDVPLVMGVVVFTTAAVWVGIAVAEVLQVVNDRRLREW